MQGTVPEVPGAKLPVPTAAILMLLIGFVMGYCGAEQMQGALHVLLFTVTFTFMYD